MTRRQTIQVLASASMVALGLIGALGSTAVQAQQKLKWAHVYETSEPYHTESVWAAAEIKKRTNGTRSVQVTLPAGTQVRFRYLADGGAFFDDDAADGYEPNGCGETHSLVIA